MSARIVVDPDGTRWVAVDLTEAQFAALSSREALAQVADALNRAVRNYAEQAVDAEIAAMVGIVPACLHCHAPLLSDECANSRGEPSGVHADCWAAYCAGLRSEDEDRRVDRAQEREMFRDWGAKS